MQIRNLLSRLHTPYGTAVCFILLAALSVDISACASVPASLSNDTASSPGTGVSFGDGAGAVKSQAMSTMLSALRDTASQEDTDVSLSGAQQVGSTLIQIEGHGQFSYLHDTGEMDITFDTSGKPPFVVKALYLPGSMYLRPPKNTLPNGRQWVATTYANGTSVKPDVPWLIATAVVLNPMGLLDTVGYGVVYASTASTAQSTYLVRLNLGDSFMDSKGAGSHDVRVALSYYMNSGASNNLDVHVALSSSSGISEIKGSIDGIRLTFHLAPGTNKINVTTPPSSLVTRLSTIPLRNGEGAGGDSDGDG